MTRTQIIFTLLLAAFASNSTPAAAACLKYGETVELVGHVAIHVFPALPGDYNNKPDPDTLLKLDEPICMSADPGDAHNRGESQQFTLTLLGSKDISPRSYRSRHVVLAGTIVHGELPEYRTPLVLNVTSVTVVPPPKRAPVEKVDHHFKAPPDNHWKQPPKTPAKPGPAKPKTKGTPADAVPSPSPSASPVDTGPPPLSTPKPGDDYLLR